MKENIFVSSIEEFNNKIQTEFMFATILSTGYCILHVDDTVTSYSESAIVSLRSAECMALLLELIWIHRHGTLLHSLLIVSSRAGL